MDRFFITILNMSFAAGVLVLAVLALRLLLKKAPKWIACALWALVALRLLLPVEIASPLSLFNALGTRSNGSVEYFHAAGGSEKPMVRFDTIRIDGAAGPEETLIDLPGNAPAVVRHSTTRYLPPLELIWLLGMAAMLLYLLWSYARLRSSIGASVPLEDRVVISDGIDGPFILGLFRPRIFIPSTLAEPQLSHVLAHERAHLARRDHWWKPLSFVLLSVHWFNPLLWLAYVLLCRDIELACDEKVLKSMDPAARPDYSQALLDLSRPRQVAACPLAFGETGVRQRVKAALSYKKPAFWLILAAVLLSAVAAVSFLTNPSYSTTVTLEEDQILRQMMEDRGMSTENLRTDVLYNRRGSAWCLMAVSDDSFMVVRRRGMRFMESVEHSSDPNPYKGYMDVPKFCFGPLVHMIRGGDARPECGAAENRFYDLRFEKSAGLIGFRARRVPYPQAVSGPVLRVRSGAQRVSAFEILRWSEEWNEDGTGLSADGPDVRDVIRENADAIPVLTWGGDLVMSHWDSAELPEEGGFRIFDAETMEQIVPFDGFDGDLFGFLQSRGAGRYWWCQEVRLRGKYIQAAKHYNTTCYDCVFCLKIPTLPEAVEGIPDDILKALYAPPLGTDPEIMVTYPIVVTDPQMRVYNMDFWEEFYAKVQAGEPADVTIALYVSDYESVLYHIRYDGDKFLLFRDNSRITMTQSPDYETDAFASLQVLSWEDHQLAVLSDRPFSGYKEYYESMYTETEHPAVVVMLWKDVATQKQGDAIPVTKQLLLKYIDDQIATYYVLQYSDEDTGEISSMLTKLRPFRDEVVENATEENVEAYWDRFWLEILEQPLPEGYGSFPKAG